MHQKFFCYLALEKMDEAQSSAQMAIEKYQKIGNEESLLSILINLIDFWNKKDNVLHPFFLKLGNKKIFGALKKQAIPRFEYLAR